VRAFFFSLWLPLPFYFLPLIGPRRFECRHFPLLECAFNSFNWLRVCAPSLSPFSATIGTATPYFPLRKKPPFPNHGRFQGLSAGSDMCALGRLSPPALPLVLFRQAISREQLFLATPLRLDFLSDSHPIPLSPAFC